MSIRSAAHKLFRRLLDSSRFFDRNSAKIVALPSDDNVNYVMLLKEHSLLEKPLKSEPKSAYKWQRNACSNYAPLERTVLRTRSVTQKKQNKHHIFAPTAGARCTIFPKLCMVIELIETIKKVSITCWSNAYFSYGVHGKFGLIDQRAVSQQ